MPTGAASQRRHALQAPRQRCPSHWQELSVIRARDFDDAQSRLCAKNGKSENLGMNNPRLFALREGVIMGMRAGCGIHRNMARVFGTNEPPRIFIPLSK